jgi:hypothetical protein
MITSVKLNTVKFKQPKVIGFMGSCIAKQPMMIPSGNTVKLI